MKTTGRSETTLRNFSAPCSLFCGPVFYPDEVSNEEDLRWGHMGRNIVRLGILYRLLEDLRLLGSLIKDYCKGEYRRVPYGSLAMIVFLVLYVINPFDLIPDYILGLGQIDDLFILILCLYLLEKDLLRYKAWKIQRSSSES